MAAGFAGAGLLGPGGGMLLARNASGLGGEMEAAAKEHGVPKELLLAVGYTNTLWEMPPPSTSPYDPEDLNGRGAYGIMQLYRNPTKDTLGRAAGLTGLRVEELKSDREANIRGAAAVLADIAREDKPSDLDGWHDVVAEYGVGAAYANEVFEVLNEGASATTSSGERVELAAHPEVEALPVFTTRAASEAPGATWWGNNGRNYSNRDRGPAQIDKIVIHVGEGTFSQILEWFRDPINVNPGSSAHYTVSKYGAIGQSVKEEDIGYHAGWWDTNKTSIGIEHAGIAAHGDEWFTNDMYRASARLAARLSRKYGIPVDRRHIIAHAEVPGCSGAGGGVSCHTDPGNDWRWRKYMNLVRSYR